jgi:NADPH:quinone reductase-like Zn-dependent oxidoreductase
MRALVLTGYGGPEVLKVEERPDPPVGPGEVRIAVKAAGLNFAETMARINLYPDAPKPPSVLGYEVAGEVESVGHGVERVKPGDRVMAATRFGGQAELVTVEEGNVYPLPDALSFEQGAAFLVVYATAYAGLHIMGGVSAGERVLIHAAAGGVGIAVTQMAKLAGAEVFGTASASKHDAIRGFGVDHAIDYRTKDFEEEVRALTNGEGVDVIMDALGPTSFRKDYRLLRSGGRLIMFGVSELQTGQGRSIRRALPVLLKQPFSSLPWWKSVNMLSENKGVFALNLLHWWDEEGLDRAVEPLMENLRAGNLKPVIAEVFPFERAGDAHRLMEERKNVGKVVLTP